METHVEELQCEDRGTNVIERVQSKEYGQNEPSSSGTGRGARGRRGGGRRGRARRVPQSAPSGRLRIRRTQYESEGQKDPCIPIRLMMEEPDFCFNRVHATPVGSVATTGTSTSNSHSRKTVAELHRLLAPQSAAAAFSAGLTLSVVSGQVAAEAASAGLLHATYQETPEGRFLSSVVLPSSTGPETIRKEQLRVDMHALQRDLIPFPLPVLFCRPLDSSKPLNHRQLQLGSCIVPPLKSASPSWGTLRDGKQDLKEDTANTTSCNNGCTQSAVNGAEPQEGKTRGSIPGTDALLNVGGRVLAFAVSQECGVSEALLHCREDHLKDVCSGSPEKSGGFVVLAVSVGSVQRSSPGTPSSATGSDSGSTSCTVGYNAESSGNSVSGCTPVLVGLEDPQASQHHRKSMGQVQLWTIPSNYRRKPRLRVILQHDGGSCRSLHWVPDSVLLLPRCTFQHHVEGRRNIQTVDACCCADGSDCYRSRLGLLVGVTDSGDIVIWSVPLTPFIPEPHEMSVEGKITSGIQCDSEIDEDGWIAEEQHPGEGAHAPVVSQAVRDYVDYRTRCCVVPPVWKFSSPNARFFCCAAAPSSRYDEGSQTPYLQQSVTLIAGAGEGRLYVFTFSVRLPPHPHQRSLNSLPSRFAVCGSCEALQCSVHVLTPGCHSSEVRCCSFLPASGSSLVALALRSSRSRSGSVVVLDLSRAAVAASTGCRGIGAVQGHSAVADTAALQVVEGNCGCCRSREIHDLAWSSWSRYLVASAENALVINLRRQQVKQLPLRSLQDPRGEKLNTMNVADDGDRCCWGCAALGPLVFYTFGGGCLVQGEASALEQRGHGGARYWQWYLAGAEDEEALSPMLQKQPQLAREQQIATQELQKLRVTLLEILREQMGPPKSSECLQHTQQQIRMPVDLMQQRVDTLVALQQLEERCELLSRGLVIAEGEAIAAASQRGKRSGRGVVKAPSILALHKVVSICPWTNGCFFAASPRVVYGGAAGIVHIKGVQAS